MLAAAAPCRTSAESATSPFCRPWAPMRQPLAFDTGPRQRDDRLGRRPCLERRSGPTTSMERWLPKAALTAILLRAGSAHPYFQLAPPKSTGRELYSGALAEQYCAEATAAGLTEHDFVATVTELTAASIADSYGRFAPMPVSELIVCGGGAHNPVLSGPYQKNSLAQRVGRPGPGRSLRRAFETSRATRTPRRRSALPCWPG